MVPALHVFPGRAPGPPALHLRHDRRRRAGRIVAPGDIVGQTRYIFEKFRAILAQAGAGFEHVVETTEYFTTTENYAKTADVRREFFRPPYPAATGVQVAGLLREGALIEIKAVAVLPG